MRTCVPLFRAAGSICFILLSSIPRYWLQSCCDDPDHVTNLTDESFVSDLFAGFHRLRRQCKDQLFLLKVRALTVLNTVQLITNQAYRATSKGAVDYLRELWCDDPVHPPNDCDMSVAQGILEHTDSGRLTIPSTGQLLRRSGWRQVTVPNQSRTGPDRPGPDRGDDHLEDVVGAADGRAETSAKPGITAIYDSFFSFFTLLLYRRLAGRILSFS